jgi:hypothetical protein
MRSFFRMQDAYIKILFWMYVKIFVISSRRCHWERLIEPVTQSIEKDINPLDPKVGSHYFRHVSVYKVTKSVFTMVCHTRCY